MLKFVLKLILFRTLLKRFWLLAILYAAARRFLPWEQRQPATTAPHRRGWL